MSTCSLRHSMSNYPYRENTLYKMEMTGHDAFLGIKQTDHQKATYCNPPGKCLCQVGSVDKPEDGSEWAQVSNQTWHKQHKETIFPMYIYGWLSGGKLMLPCFNKSNLSGNLWLSLFSPHILPCNKSFDKPYFDQITQFDVFFQPNKKQYMTQHLYSIVYCSLVALTPTVWNTALDNLSTCTRCLVLSSAWLAYDTEVWHPEGETIWHYGAKLGCDNVM